MGLFLSTYYSKIDKKGRTTIPAPYRAILTAQAFSGVIMYPSFINPCIEACGMQRIEQLHQGIDQMDPYSDERDAFATAIFGTSHQLAFDPEGRVVIPTKLLEEGHISEKIVFLGKGSTFEIWNPEAYEAYELRARELAKRDRAMLRLQPKKPLEEKSTQL